MIEPLWSLIVGIWGMIEGSLGGLGGWSSFGDPKWYPYLIGLHYKGVGVYGISLSPFLLICFSGALIQGLRAGERTGQKPTELPNLATQSPEPDPH